MRRNSAIPGPLEAVNGVVMIGVSTAALMGLFRDAIKKTIEAKQTVLKPA